MVEVNSLPNITAPKESPTFAIMFNPKMENCLLSKRLLDSSANEDIVVNDRKSQWQLVVNISDQDSK